MFCHFYLYTRFTAYVLETFTQSLCVRDDSVVPFLVSLAFVYGVWLLLLAVWFCILFRDHLGYLHLSRTPCRHGCSVLGSSCVEQTALAVCECVDHTVFGSYVVVTAHCVFVSLWGFSVDSHGQDSVVFWCDDGVQKWH